MFKYQGSGIYDNPSTNYFNFRLLGNDPVDQSLQILRKLAEVKKLSEYICSTPTRQSVDFIGPPFKTYSNGNTPQRSDYDDLIIVGYNGFMCGRCLVAHPLPIYRDRFKFTIHYTKHHCNSESLLDSKNLDRQKNYLAGLYKNMLPSLMLRTIKLWTSSHYLLKAVMASSPNNGHKFIYISSQMKWATRAIHEGDNHSDL
jgi:hypothetical protein